MVNLFKKHLLKYNKAKLILQILFLRIKYIAKYLEQTYIYLYLSLLLIKRGRT